MDDATVADEAARLDRLGVAAAWIAVTWLGAGAVAAFDGLMLGWGATDTLLVVEVAIGVVAAVVGAAALAARHDEPATGRARTRSTGVAAAG